jgi:hypothetical protein
VPPELLLPPLLEPPPELLVPPLLDAPLELLLPPLPEELALVPDEPPVPPPEQPDGMPAPRRINGAQDRRNVR